MIHKKTVSIEPVLLEVSDMKTVNELFATGEYQKPKYSEKRDVYILVRRDVKMSE